MTPLEVLRGARSKIEQGWTQNATARDPRGAPCPPLDPEACCWCIFGAAIATGATLPERLAAYEVLKSHFHNDRMTVDAFNDASWRTKAEVLQLFGTAIDQLESEAT